MAETHHERLLYIPNERAEGDQPGPRRTFESLLANGKLAAYTALPVDVYIERDGPDQAFARLLATARSLEPSIVLWQHPYHDMPSDVLSQLKRHGSYLVYHEGDAYGWVRKRLPARARTLARASDLTLLPGTGMQSAIFRSAGARDRGYVPNSVDLHRFGTDGRRPSTERLFDVVMVGNRVTTRLPGAHGLPGMHHRERLARQLGDLLGDRLAIYGRGWSGFRGARGPLPYAEQVRAARESWLTVSWNHFHRVPYCFSDRLPVSLAAGVAHVTCAQPGYDELFEDGCELFLARSVPALVRRVESLLAGPRDVLDAVGQRGRAFAERFLSDEVVFRRLLEVVVGHREGQPLPEPRDWMTG
jgi:hypothetical protein